MELCHAAMCVVLCDHRMHADSVHVDYYKGGVVTVKQEVVLSITVVRFFRCEQKVVVNS